VLEPPDRLCSDMTVSPSSSRRRRERARPGDPGRPNRAGGADCVDSKRSIVSLDACGGDDGLETGVSVGLETEEVSSAAQMRWVGSIALSQSAPSHRTREGQNKQAKIGRGDTVTTVKHTQCPPRLPASHHLLLTASILARVVAGWAHERGAFCPSRSSSDHVPAPV
jgi:hypothetical protein